MYYDMNGNKNADYRFGKSGKYEKEVFGGSFNPMFKKAAKKRTDIVGKKCTKCFTIKSIAGECINCD